MFVHNRRKWGVPKKGTLRWRSVMASTTRFSLSAEQEADAQALAQRIRELTEEEVVQMARLLVSKPDREIFGDTEFELRDIVLKVGAKALEERLRQKKTAITDAV
jgi:parvulin-like peptidyl-prolyl isomerase